MMAASSELGGMRETRLALSFRIGSGPVEHVGEALDVAQEQLVMSSPIQLEVGLRLEITIRVPIEFSGSPFSKMRFSGRILHETRVSVEGFVYKVEIERSRAEVH